MYNEKLNKLDWSERWMFFRMFWEFKRFIAISTLVRHLCKFPAPLHMGNMGAGCAQIARITITDKCRIRRWEGERSWLILHLLQRQQTINLFVSRTHWQGMWASLGLAPATVGSEVRGESFVELHLLWLPQRDSILRELWTATRFWQINLRLSRWAAGTNKFLLAQLKEARHMPQFSN